MNSPVKDQLPGEKTWTLWQTPTETSADELNCFTDMWQKQDVLQFLELYNTPSIFSCETKVFMWGQCQQIVSVRLQRKTFHVLLNSCGLVSWTWSQQPLKHLTATFYPVISDLLFYFPFLQLVVKKFVSHRILSFLWKLPELSASFQPLSVVVGIEKTEFCREAFGELIIFLFAPAFLTFRTKIW